MSLNYEALKPLVEKAARKAHASFPDYYSLEDTQQDLWVWILENEHTVINIVSDSHTSEIENNQPLFNLLMKKAVTSLKAEHAASNMYGPDDVFYYSRQLVESVLEVIYRHEDWQSFASAYDKLPTGKPDPATAGNNLASYVDVSRAITELTQDQYSVIVWRHKYAYTFENIGYELGISRQAARERYEGAVSALQRSLGARELSDLQRPSGGHTDPSTGESAQIYSESQYNG